MWRARTRPAGSHDWRQEIAKCTQPSDVFESFVAAFKARNVDELVDLYEPDAIFYDTGANAVGLDQIRERWELFAKTYRVLDYTVDTRDEMLVAPDWSIAHMTMTVTLTTSEDNADPFRVSGRSTEIIHRGSDQCWRFVIDHASVPIDEAA